MDPDGSNNSSRQNRKANAALKSSLAQTESQEIKILGHPESHTQTESDPNTQEENPLKIEWSLFWEGLLGDHSTEDVEAAEGENKKAEDQVRVLTPENIHNLTKELSNQRKQLHKQIEKLNKEIELNSAKLESLRLVGSEPDDTIRRINELSDKGQELSLELGKLDQKLKWVRAHEDDEKEAATDKDLA